MSDGLPNKFIVNVERKPDGWWKITVLDHPGVYIVHRDLQYALCDVPLSLKMLIRLNDPALNAANKAIGL